MLEEVTHMVECIDSDEEKLEHNEGTFLLRRMLFIYFQMRRMSLLIL